MADPISERILADLLTDAATVTTGNGYNYTLTVERQNRGAEGNRSRDGLCVVSVGDASPLEGSGQFRAWSQSYMCHIFAEQSDTDTTDWITKANRMSADLTKALMVDHTRSGLAYDTTIDMPSLDIDQESAITIATVTVNISFDHEWDDPYTGRA